METVLDFIANMSEDDMEQLTRLAKVLGRGMLADDSVGTKEKQQIKEMLEQLDKAETQYNKVDVYIEKMKKETERFVAFVSYTADELEIPRNVFLKDVIDILKKVDKDEDLEDAEFTVSRKELGFSE